MALLFNYDHFVDIFILISFSYLLLYCCIVITWGIIWLPSDEVTADRVCMWMCIKCMADSESAMYLSYNLLCLPGIQ